MIVENAERLGLAQLHQLRGRLRRGAGKSVCVRIAGLARDCDLFGDIEQVAAAFLARLTEQAPPLIRRWLGNGVTLWGWLGGVEEPKPIRVDSVDRDLLPSGHGIHSPSASSLGIIEDALEKRHH